MTSVLRTFAGTFLVALSPVLLYTGSEIPAVSACIVGFLFLTKDDKDGRKPPPLSDGIW